MSTEAMTRYTSPPTKFDIAPYGTFCTVHLNDDGTLYELYVQTSKDEADPLWISAQELLLVAYKKRLVDKDFVFECLQYYNS